MDDARSSTAYFSMEFAVRPDLPIYAGGLGVLAGDLLKAASDRDYPLVGVGLLFREGYFRQRLRAGRQEVRYSARAPGTLPVEPVLAGDSAPLRFSLQMAGQIVWLRAFSLRIGRVTLYLLDASDPENRPEERLITRRLYSTDPGLRLKQEVVLGVGGYRLLDLLGLRPSVLHINEGHAAFALLERARLFAEHERCSFAAALAATRPGNVFTTHTSVAAAFDSFPISQVSAALLGAGGALTGAVLDARSLTELGAAPEAGTDKFSMAALAVQGCARINAVSRAHREISQSALAAVLPLTTEPAITYVTNGVHLPSWTAAESAQLWREAYGEHWWLAQPPSAPFSGVISDARLWQLRETLRRALIVYVQQRVPQGRSDAGLSERALTIGFARRFTAYKRPGILLSDPRRLARLLSTTARPVQLILAGKAHPADIEGQAWIRAWLAFARSREAAGRVAFVEDYDLTSATKLVQGVDVWLNTPLPPWEACGTSGMKVVPNGGLNVSSRDGWWLEAEQPGVGFSFGAAAGEDHSGDAEALFTLLEREVIPRFYERDGEGLPRRWLSHVRESMGRLGQRFGADRMFEDYREQIYRPAAQEYAAALAARAPTVPSVHYAPRPAERGERAPIEPHAQKPGVEP